jgi:hypothetical protein
MHQMSRTKGRPRVGDVKIDTQIAVLDQIDQASDDLFHEKITPAQYRKQATSLIRSLSDIGTTMFAAVYVNSEQEVEDYYGNLEQRHGQREQ